MITVMWIGVEFATALTLLHAVSRPASSWAAADRDKTWWVAGLVFSMLFVLFALFIVPAYLLAVAPRLRSGDAVGNPFLKR
jgi:hypothetical protein